VHGERASARAAAASRRPLSPVTPNGTLVGQAPAGVPFVVCDVARSSAPACDRGPTGLQIHSDRGVSFTRSGTPECNARHSGRTRGGVAVTGTAELVLADGGGSGGSAGLIGLIVILLLLYLLFRK
jgi:hypothetical protein